MRRKRQPIKRSELYLLHFDKKVNYGYFASIRVYFHSLNEMFSMFEDIIYP